MLWAIAGMKPTSPIVNIHKRPNFSTLWHLQRQIFDSLCKVGTVELPLDVHARYILWEEAFTLFSSK